MIHTNKNFDTQHVVDKNKRVKALNYFDSECRYATYCAYCGKQLEPEIGWWDRYERVYHYNCDCEDAVLEHEINLKIQEEETKHREAVYNLKKQLPKAKYGMVNKLPVFEKL
jgi:hypothetical protein